jgi:hypothetical protein
MNRSRYKTIAKKQRTKTTLGKVRGLRTLVVDGKKFLYRISRNTVEIRDGNKKLLVRFWQLFDISQEEFEKNRWLALCDGMTREECDCGVVANRKYAIRPSVIADYLRRNG